MSNVTAPLSGRKAVRGRVDSIDTPPVSPVVDAAAHVICAMGGHIPKRDTEAPGACQFHRQIAAVALEQAIFAWFSV